MNQHLRGNQLVAQANRLAHAIAQAHTRQVTAEGLLAKWPELNVWARLRKNADIDHQRDLAAAEYIREDAKKDLKEAEAALAKFIQDFSYRFDTVTRARIDAEDENTRLRARIESLKRDTAGIQEPDAREPETTTGEWPERLFGG